MKTYKWVVAILACILFSLTVVSCKKAAKSVIKEVGEESVEYSMEKVGKNAGKRIGKNVAGEAESIFKTYIKSSPIIGNAVKKFSSKFQKNIGEEMATDPRFYKSMTSSESVLNDFIKFTSKSPKAGNDIKFLKMFSNSSVFGKGDLANVIIKEEKGKIKFLRNIDEMPLAEYKDGVVKLQRFLPDGVTRNPILDGELLPNTLYKIVTEDGANILCKSDAMGKIISVEAKNINPKTLTSKIIGDIDLGSEFEKTIKEAQKLSNGKNVDIKYVLHHSEDYMEPKYVKVDINCQGKKMMSKTVENTNWGKFARVELKNLKKLNPEIDKYIKYLKRESMPGASFFNDDDLIVEAASNGRLRISVKNSQSIMEVDGNIIRANPGSTVKNGQMNEFLNYRLPNKTYDIGNGALIYETDAKGNSTHVLCDRNKLLELTQRSRTNSHIQKQVQGGMDGVDGGHLIARNTNGPNEAINQIPMSKSVNETGRWRELERIEEEALKQGKKVISERRVISPNKTQFITIIDGKKVTDEVVEVLP